MDRLLALRRSDERPWCRWFSTGYGWAAVGVAVFAVGGFGDGIWHTIFGIETSLDALLQLNTSAGAITTTEDHEFWNDTDQTWQQTQHLDVGDLLLTANGETVSVEGLDWATTHYATAYDLTIDTYHTYYIEIGDTHTLVHNGNGPRTVPDPPPQVRPSGVPDRNSAVYMGLLIFVCK